jgi:hypothetical protein
MSHDMIVVESQHKRVIIALFATLRQLWARIILAPYWTWNIYISNEMIKPKM